MKIILTHKKQLRGTGDVVRFLKYLYGPRGERPVLPVEGHFPGLPTGNARLDAESLLCQHHGGKAAKGRSIVFSTEYFQDRDIAEFHAAGLAKTASAFRWAWAAEANALSVVHLTQGEKQWLGMWRLDCHLILSNSDGTKGLQWSQAQCSQMQDMDWIPHPVKTHFDIKSGKGTGIARTQKIPYPKSKGLVSYEIGSLTPQQLEERLSHGIYGVPRRAKDGRIISLEAKGERINIARARELVRVRDGIGSGPGILSESRPFESNSLSNMADPGFDQSSSVLISQEGIDYDMGRRTQRRFKSACTDFVHERRRRLSTRHSRGNCTETGFLGVGTSIGGGQSTSLAGQSATGALLTRSSNVSSHLTKALSTVESINLIPH